MKAPEKFCASAPETVATVLLCYYKKYILLYSMRSSFPKILLAPSAGQLKCI